MYVIYFRYIEIDYFKIIDFVNSLILTFSKNVEKKIILKNFYNFKFSDKIENFTENKETYIKRSKIKFYIFKNIIDNTKVNDAEKKQIFFISLDFNNFLEFKKNKGDILFFLYHNNSNNIYENIVNIKNIFVNEELYFINLDDLTEIKQDEICKRIIL